MTFDLNKPTPIAGNYMKVYHFTVCRLLLPLLSLGSLSSSCSNDSASNLQAAPMAISSQQLYSTIFGSDNQGLTSALAAVKAMSFADLDRMARSGLASSDHAVSLDGQLVTLENSNSANLLALDKRYGTLGSYLQAKNASPLSLSASSLGSGLRQLYGHGVASGDKDLRADALGAVVAATAWSFYQANSKASPITGQILALAGGLVQPTTCAMGGAAKVPTGKPLPKGKLYDPTIALAIYRLAQDLPGSRQAGWIDMKSDGSSMDGTLWVGGLDVDKKTYGKITAPVGQPVRVTANRSGKGGPLPWQGGSPPWYETSTPVPVDPEDVANVQTCVDMARAGMPLQLILTATGLDNAQ